MKRTALAALLLAASGVPGLCGSYDDLNTGIQYFNQDQPDTAIGWFDKALAAGDLIADHKRIAYLDRGQSYLAKGDRDKAIADFTAAIAAKPDDPQGYRERAAAYRAAGKYDLALDDYLRLNALRPQDYSTLMSIGWLTWQTDRQETGPSAFLPFAQMDIMSWLGLQLVNARRGEPMTRFVENVTARNWPGHIPRFFQGSLTESEMLDAAKSADVKIAPCQANFFAGMWRLVHKDTGGAVPLLKAATQSCAEGSTYHRIALIELAKDEPKGEMP